MRLQVGLYAVYLLDWLTVFNKEQFLVLRLEDHASNVKYTMHRVFQFLNLGRNVTRETVELAWAPWTRLAVVLSESCADSVRWAGPGQAGQLVQ